MFFSRFCGFSDSVLAGSSLFGPLPTVLLHGLSSYGYGTGTGGGVGG